MAGKRLCAVPECGKPYHANGYCARHESKFRAYGDPLAGRTGPSPGEPLAWIRENAGFQGDECLIWPFERTHWGYGTVRANGKRRVASRVMCEEAHGDPQSPDLDAAHSCGNGAGGCVNPKHLRFSTRTENIADAVNDGTWMKGERARSAKLTRAEVIEIRRLGGTMLQSEIGERFGIGGNTISRILSGKRWGWLKDDAPEIV